MSKLLVSVRSVREAEIALCGGAALIDVKEPAAGALGRSDSATIEAVIKFIAGRRSVSAALGELSLAPAPPALRGLRFAKWGLAGCRSRSDWRRDLARARQELRATSPGCELVAVAYADWVRAEAPPPRAVCDFACEQSCGAFLVDTWCKDGTTLLDWLSVEALGGLTEACTTAGVGVALAGSLGIPQIDRLRALEPEWFAVRGLVCTGRLRDQSIDLTAVRLLTQYLSGESGLPGAEIDHLHV
jgi:uncharacterized protein (UPF0264 family)